MRKISIQIPYLQNANVASLTETVSRFGQWWLDEFLSLLPPKIGEWLRGPAAKVLLISQDNTSVSVHLRTSNGINLDNLCVGHSEYSALSIETLLRRNQLTREDVTVGLGLPYKNFFRRDFILPLQANRSLDEIVARDLAGKTPFKPAVVYHDYGVTREGGKLKIVQHLTKRETAQSAAELLQIDIGDIDFIEAVADAPNCDRFVIALRKNTSVRSALFTRAALALSASAVLLALLAGAARYWHQEAILDGLGAEIAKERQQAQGVKNTFTALELRHSGIRRLLVERRDAPSLVQVWDETTRLLPADSWLTELNFTRAPQSKDYRITVSGYSTAAANLVGSFDQSSLFKDAALTTTVAVDPIEQRERFSLQAQVK